MTNNSKQSIAEEFLALCSQQMYQAVMNRRLYVKLARDYGMTTTAIGEALGLPEQRVRQIIAEGE